MKTKEPTYDFKNADHMNLVLSGLIRDIRKGEVKPEEAKAVSIVADKINKNVMNQLTYKKMTKNDTPIPFLLPVTKLEEDNY